MDQPGMLLEQLLQAFPAASLRTAKIPQTN
jgi:hypothetical protein